MAIEYIDPNRCAVCGGKCCHLYEKASRGGMIVNDNVKVYHPKAF